MTKVTARSGLCRKRTFWARWASSTRSPCCQSHSPSSRVSRAAESTFSSMDSEQMKLIHQLLKPRDALLFRLAESVDERGKIGRQLLHRNAERLGVLGGQHIEPRLVFPQRAAQGRFELLLHAGGRVAADRPDRKHKRQVLP